MDPFHVARKKQNIDAWAEMKVKLSKCDFINWRNNKKLWERIRRTQTAEIGLGFVFCVNVSRGEEMKNKIAKQPTKRSLWCNRNQLKVSFRCAVWAASRVGDRHCYKSHIMVSNDVALGRNGIRRKLCSCKNEIYIQAEFPCNSWYEIEFLLKSSKKAQPKLIFKKLTQEIWNDFDWCYIRAETCAARNMSLLDTSGSVIDYEFEVKSGNQLEYMTLHIGSVMETT